MEKEMEQIQLPYLSKDNIVGTEKVVFTDTIYPEIRDTTYTDKQTGVKTVSPKLHCSVMLKGVEYHWTPNNTTKDSIIDLLGKDESKWIKQSVELGTLKQQVGKGITRVIYTTAYLKSQEKGD